MSHLWSFVDFDIQKYTFWNLCTYGFRHLFWYSRSRMSFLFWNSVIFVRIWVCTFRLDCNSREETVHIDCGRSFDCTFRCHNILCTYEFRHLFCHFRSRRSRFVLELVFWHLHFDTHTDICGVTLRHDTSTLHFDSTCRYMSHVTS